MCVCVCICVCVCVCVPASHVMMSRMLNSPEFSGGLFPTRSHIHSSEVQSVSARQTQHVCKAYSVWCCGGQALLLRHIVCGGQFLHFPGFSLEGTNMEGADANVCLKMPNTI